MAERIVTANAQIDARVIEIKKLVSDPAQILAVRNHLEEVISGDAFRGSHRSQQFLAYIVEKAIEGEFDGLKERVIGVELFHRSPSYDTSEDAIVRVTASDVRKRLLQHYGRYGTGAAYRISMPSGSYIPEITCSTVTPQLPIDREVPQTLEPAPVIPPQAVLTDRSTENARPTHRHRVLIALAILFSVLLAFGAGYSIRPLVRLQTPAAILPWSAFLRSGHMLKIISSDPEFAFAQDITGNAISLSDYANERFVPDHSTLSPQILEFFQKHLHGNEVAEVDVPIVASAVSLLSPTPDKISIRTSRSMRLSDFQTDDDFILLGSPLSNPWWGLFDKQLDFNFAFDGDSNQEVIKNGRPQGQELHVYIPTARGLGTGQSFAIVAFVPNPHQSGSVLMIGGADAEGTEAAGRLVTRIPELSNALRGCKIAANGSIQHFEILLRVTTMAGLPSDADVVACHRLT